MSIFISTLDQLRAYILGQPIPESEGTQAIRLAKDALKKPMQPGLEPETVEPSYAELKSQLDMIELQLRDQQQLVSEGEGRRDRAKEKLKAANELLDSVKGKVGPRFNRDREQAQRAVQRFSDELKDAEESLKRRQGLLEVCQKRLKQFPKSLFKKLEKEFELSLKISQAGGSFANGF